MVKHRFATGQRVALVASKDNTNVRPGIYTIVRPLPEAGFGRQYRAKHDLDSHERVLDEAQLRET